MTSYIEVTFINNILIMMLSLMLAHYLLLSRMDLRRMIVYAVVISLVSILFWNRYSFVIMILVELFACCVWFKFHFKVFALSYSLRFLMSLTCYVCYGGSFHLLVYFVPAQTYTILYFWVIGGILLIACLRKWKYYISQAAYIYEMKLWSSQKKWNLYGYLDTGNLITYHEVPIIFAVSKYYEYFKNENIELVVMNTMNGTSSIRVYPCQIELKGTQKQQAYICFDKPGIIPMHCECLLNLHVLTR